MQGSRGSSLTTCRGQMEGQGSRHANPKGAKMTEVAFHVGFFFPPLLMQLNFLSSFNLQLLFFI
jgi:hypothetical protein